jgi:hypothetical protein
MAVEDRAQRSGDFRLSGREILRFLRVSFVVV